MFTLIALIRSYRRQLAAERQALAIAAPAQSASNDVAAPRLPLAA